MESKFLGLLYTLLSRVCTDTDWFLMGPIDADRVLYVNDAPGMGSRRKEDAALVVAKLHLRWLPEWLPESV